MENAKSIATPLPTSTRLTDRDAPSTDEERKLNGKIPYTSVLGTITYATTTTWTNLACVIGVVSWYMLNPRRKHWEAVKHIFWYLRGIENVQLTFGSANPTNPTIQTPTTLIIWTIESWHQAIYSPMVMHGPVNHRGWVHSCVESNQESNLPAPTIGQFFGHKPNRP